MAIKFVTTFPRQSLKSKAVSVGSLAAEVSKSLRVPPLTAFELDPSTGQFSFELAHEVRAKQLTHWPDLNRVLKLGRVFVGMENGIPKFVLVAVRRGVIRISIDANAMPLLNQISKVSGVGFKEPLANSPREMVRPKRIDQQEKEDALVEEFLSRLPKPDFVRFDEKKGRNVGLTEADLRALELIAED